MFWKCEFRGIFFKDSTIIKSLQKDFKQKIVDPYCALVLKWKHFFFYKRIYSKKFIFDNGKSKYKCYLKTNFEQRCVCYVMFICTTTIKD